MGGEGDGAQAAATDLVDAEGGGGVGDAGRVRAAWRAGFWPWAAVRTWPRMTSSTASGFDAGAGDRGLDGRRAQDVGRNAGEGAVETADRRA